MTPESERDPLDDLPWPTCQGQAQAQPSAAITSAIRKECTHNLCAKPGLSASARVALSLLLSAAVVALLYFLGKRSGRPESSLQTALYGAAGWGSVQALVLMLGLARPPGRRGSRNVRLAILIAVPILFVGYLLLIASSVSRFSEFASGSQGAHAITCSGWSLLFGAFISAGVLLLWRGTDPFHPGLSGALAGLVGGLGTALAVGAGCPSEEAWHLCFSHGLTLVAFVLVGWGLGRRLLSP